ncbi:MAG: alkaline phosphatase D family protein [Planctomycetales bacterium]|nr:alkaline phosphatase D family protein [Planctomycetales bacterium]
MAFSFAFAVSHVVAPIAIWLPALALAKPPLPTPAETPVVGEADALLLRKLYHERDREGGLASLQDDDEYLALIKKHDLRLLSGPMLGDVTDRSARVWLRTATAARVEVVLHEGDTRVASAAAMSSTDRDFTVVLSFGQLKPSTDYRYEVRIDGQPAHGALGLTGLPTFRTAPPAGAGAKFSVAFGGGARYVPEKERIWDTVAAAHPQAFLFLGDNIYIDEPQWRSKQRVMYYRRQMRPEFRRLTASTACYAIWDDHDFGANDTAGGPDPFRPEWKLPVWQVFRENWNNPSYGGGEKQPGCWFDFHIGDVHFIMTDGRYYRSFKDGTMLGPVQKQWLMKTLRESKAKFKVIASGTLWTELADKGGKDSWWGVPEEREEIFSLIDRERIGGVFLISADRHRTDIYRIRRPNGYDLYEFETSKLTNDHTHPTKPQALFSYNQGNFYGRLDFDFTQPDPTMTFRCIDIDGKLIHAMPLRLSQLQAPDK